MKHLFIIVIFCISIPTKAQSLLDDLNQEMQKQPDTVYTIATFKATKLINGQTVETVGKQGLNFMISHRFGNVNGGISEFFGLDIPGSSIRFGLDYGLSKKMDIGIGRFNHEKLYDGYFKYKILRQSSGAVMMPFSLSWYTSIAISTIPDVPNRKNLFSSRLSYTHEAIIARKITDKLSIQLIPGIVHRNLVETKKNENIVAFAGIGGRYKITKRVALTSEYYYVISKYTSGQTVNPLAFGLEIETGGHIFQLNFSNSFGLDEKVLVTENKNNWKKGESRLGFNIIRNFDLSGK